MEDKHMKEFLNTIAYLLSVRPIIGETEYMRQLSSYIGTIVPESKSDQFDRFPLAFYTSADNLASDIFKFLDD